MIENPHGLVFDALGNLFLCDLYTNRIRKITPNGNVTTFVGYGSSVWGHGDGSGTNAVFKGPYAIAIDSFGFFYVTDIWNNKIRKITPEGQVTTFASGFDDPSGIAVDKESGNVFVYDRLGGNQIEKITPSGEVSSFASGEFSHSRGLFIDDVGNIYIADFGNHRIKKVSATGVVTTVAGGEAGFADGIGTVAQFNSPIFIASNSNSGDLYVSDSVNHRVRKIKLPTSFPGPLPVCDSTWHHIALTYTGSSSTNLLSAYVDGSIVNSTIVSYSISSSTLSSLRIGWTGIHTSKELFSGLISDLRIFSRSLISSEIGSLSVIKPITSASPSATVSAIMSSSASSSHSPDRSRTASATVTSTGTSSTSPTSSGSSVTELDMSNGATLSSTPSSTATGSSSPTATVSSSSGIEPLSSSFQTMTAVPTFTRSSGATQSSSRSATSTPSTSISGTITSSSTPSLSFSATSTTSSLSSKTSTASSSDTSTSTPSSSAFPSYFFNITSSTTSASATSSATSPAVVLLSCLPGFYFLSSSSQCTPCVGDTYSYSGALSCSSCPSGISTFISSSLGCRPSSSTSTGPIDTSFYLSGSQSEGVSAFSNIVNSNGLTYYSSSSSFPNTALTISSGSYLSTPLLSTLPTGSSPFTVTSWVKCDASSLTDTNPSSVVIAWGDSQVSTSTNFTAATLAVTSTSRMLDVATVRTLAGNGIQGASDGQAQLSSFFNPSGISVDANENVYVADTNNHRIRKISQGLTSTFAGSTSGFADGTGVIAKFNFPQGVAIDLAGNVYVADTNNNRIRKILSSGVVSTVAGSGTLGFSDGPGTNAIFYRPYGIAVDLVSGNIFVSDRYNHRIRRITPGGFVSTISGGATASFADGTGLNARFNYPQGISIDNSGNNLYIADTDNQRIRKLTISTNIVKTIAGSGVPGDVNGLGTDATFSSPSGVSIDTTGNIYVTDLNNLVRKIDALSGMVTTIAGSGVPDFFDGASTVAMFNGPTGIFADVSSGNNLYIADNNNHRIRKITLSLSFPGPLPVCDSTWHNIAISYSNTISTVIRRLQNLTTPSGILTAYIDGSNYASILASYSIPSSSSSSSTFRIGSNGLNGEMFAGSISDVRIFSRSLNETELRSLSARPPTVNVNTTSIEKGGGVTSSSTSTMLIVIGAVVGIIILSASGFGYIYMIIHKAKKKKELELEEEEQLKVVKSDTLGSDVRLDVIDTSSLSANWNMSMTATPPSNISSASISLASSRVTAYEDKNASPKSVLKSNTSSSNRETGSHKKNSKNEEDDDDDLILATRREFPEDDEDDDAILPGAVNRIKDGETEELMEEYNIQGLVNSVEGTVVGEMAGSLLSSVGASLEGLALASVSIPSCWISLERFIYAL
jgi:sugar lactone lactonase YvrE